MHFQITKINKFSAFLILVVGITALPAQAIPIKGPDPSGWFEFKATVNYPKGAINKVHAYAEYNIATKTENGQTTVDYDNSTITFTQKDGSLT